MKYFNHRKYMLTKKKSKVLTWDILFSYTLLVPMEAFAFHLKEENEKYNF